MTRLFTKSLYVEAQWTLSARYFVFGWKELASTHAFSHASRGFAAHGSGSGRSVGAFGAGYELSDVFIKLRDTIGDTRYLHTGDNSLALLQKNHLPFR